MAFQHVAPVVIDRLSSPRQVVRLRRVTKSAMPNLGSSYQETLVQALVDLDPAILPIEELEPAFIGIRPVCQELSLGPAGERVLDNLLISPEGRVCLVECKLWQNPESVRAVVGQILDYAAAIAQYTYDDLLAATRKNLKLTEGDPICDKVLGRNADDDDRLDLIAGISRSLRLGNFLLLVIGDRIRPPVQGIATLLQDRASLGFTFGLIEMAIYSGDTGGGPYYVQPRILARTEIITRTVFLAASDQEAPAISRVEAAQKSRTISEQEFYDSLAKVDATYPNRLQSFFDRCRDVGCEPKLLRRFVLYADDPIGGRVNLGSVAKDGTVEFWCAGRDQRLGEPVGRTYMDRIASLLPGSTVKDDFDNQGSWYIRYKGRSAIALNDMLEHEQGWLDAISDVVTKVRAMDHA